MPKSKDAINLAIDWLEEDGLLLLESWSRDGYTFKDIANRIGISISTLTCWRANYPEIDKALKKGKELVDYKVENALLKSALGYTTKETKIITTMRKGKVIETVRETTTKEQAPNYNSIRFWLTNRQRDKWKNNRDNEFNIEDRDNDIQVTITRAPNNNTNNDSKDTEKHSEDNNWQDEINDSVTIRKSTPEEIELAKAKRKEEEKRKKDAEKMKTVVEDEIDDIDYWPEDFKDEE